MNEMRCTEILEDKLACTQQQELDNASYQAVSTSLLDKPQEDRCQSTVVAT